MEIHFPLKEALLDGIGGCPMVILVVTVAREIQVATTGAAQLANKEAFRDTREACRDKVTEIQFPPKEVLLDGTGGCPKKTKEDILVVPVAGV